MKALLVGLFLAISLWRVTAAVLDGPSHVFAETRLMPLFVAASGHTVYPSPGEGPFYVPLYPPLSFLLYFPVLVGGHPVDVLRLGTAIAEICTLLPVWLFLVSSEPGKKRTPLLLVALGLLACWIHLSPILISLIFIHADAPAVFVAALGIWILFHARRRNSSVLLSLALVVLSLAPWAKQTFFPVVVLPFFAVWGVSRARALLCLAVAAGLQALWAGLFGLLFGFRNLFFWLVEFSSRHPWMGPPFETLSASNRVLVVESLSMVAFVSTAVLRRRAQRTPWSSMASELWALLFLAALLLWPTSLIGYVKVGGAVNSFLPTLYFLACASLLLLVPRDPAPDPEDLRWPPGSAMLVMAAVLGIQTSVENVNATKRVARGTWDADFVFNTVRKNPDQALFPWFPLSTHLASGVFAPSELGIRERRTAGLTISREELQGQLPRSLRFVVCGQEACSGTLEELDVVGTTQYHERGKTWQIYEVRGTKRR